MGFKISGSFGNKKFFSNILLCATLASKYRTFRWMINSNEIAINFKLSLDGKTLSFYSTGDAYQQFNNINYSYCYAVIGGYDIGVEISVGTTYIITSNQINSKLSS